MAELKAQETNPGIPVHLLRSEPCGNCKELNKECACIRNKCIFCGGPVGNITFTACDGCWDKTDMS